MGVILSSRWGPTLIHVVENGQWQACRRAQRLPRWSFGHGALRVASKHQTGRDPTKGGGARHIGSGKGVDPPILLEFSAGHLEWAEGLVATQGDNVPSADLK